MDPLNALLLALVQGLTEFLPISSSAHLALFPLLTGSADQGLAFDVAVHVGTLVSVVGCFRHELLRMLAGLGRAGDPEARLLGQLLLASVPLGLCGLLFAGAIEASLRSATVIGVASIAFGIVLLLADRLGSRSRDEHGLTLGQALAIGAAQALALIPGTSRSGITMTAALALGLDRRAAARFSFLLSIPAIVMAGGYAALQLLQAPVEPAWGPLLLATVTAALSAWLCIRAFLAFVERVGMLPFVVYRVLLGALLLVLY
ncbi:MAG TPA: undecaprenyl-diphosphate phosphatase [Gammaproteobacteria bacterium]